MPDVFLTPIISSLYVILHHISVTHKCLTYSESDEFSRRRMWFWKEGRQNSAKTIKQMQLGSIQWSMSYVGMGVLLHCD
jgi:hypothetical protein